MTIYYCEHFQDIGRSSNQFNNWLMWNNLKIYFKNEECRYRIWKEVTFSHIKSESMARYINSRVALFCYLECHHFHLLSCFICGWAGWRWYWPLTLFMGWWVMAQNLQEQHLNWKIKHNQKWDIGGQTKLAWLKFSDGHLPPSLLVARKCNSFILWLWAGSNDPHILRWQFHWK